MAKKKDMFDFDDDFDFDNDDFNFDDEGGFEGPPQSGARKAVTAFKGTFVSGVKDTVFSEHFQEETVKKMLPQAYGDTFAEFNDVKRQLGQLKYQITGDLDKQLDGFKKENNKVIKSLTSKLPSGISSRINNWADRFDKGYGPSIDLEAMQTESIMNDVFGASSQVANDYQTKAALDTNAETKLQTGLVTNTNDLLFGIGANIGKLVGYQDDVGVKYQRKMLELSYKQLLTGRKQLDVSEKLLALQTSSNETIIKNTGLPDVVKMHNSEIVAQTLKQRFIGKATEPMFNSIGKVTGRISDKVGGKIRDTLSANGDQINTMFGEVLNMFMPDSNDDNDPSAQTSAEKIAVLLGSQMSGSIPASLVDKFAPGIRDRIGTRDDVVRTGAMLDSYRLRGAGMAKNAFATGQTGNRHLDGLIKFLELSDLREEQNTLIQSSPEEALTQAQIFDVQSKRSLTDVIPGLLGRIHSEMRRFNGDVGHGNLKYDWKMGGFSEEQSLDERFVKEIVSNSKPAEIRQTENAILNSIDPDGKLSKETREKIARQVTISTLTNEPISFQNFLDPASPQHIKEFEDFVSGTYNTRAIEGSDGSSKYTAKFIQNASADFLKIDNQLQLEVRRLRGESTDPLQALLTLAEQGDMSTMRRYPFIKVSSSGVYSIDYPAYYDYLRNAPVDLVKGSGPSPTGGGADDTTDPIRERLNNLLNTDNVQRITDGRDRIVGAVDNKIDFTREKVKVLAGYTNPDRYNQRALNVPVDTSQAGSVFVSNDSSPRLDVISMQRGMYRLVATGGVVRSLNDITGDVMDDQGRIVLTQQHVQDGIYDQKGNRIKIGLGGLIGKASNVGNTLKGLTPLAGINNIKNMALGKLPKGGLGVKADLLKKRMASWAEEKDIHSMISVSNLKNTVTQTNTLSEIKKLLQEQADDTKAKYNDKNADGYRDGSWQDILKRRQEERDRKDGGPTTIIREAEPKKKGGILSKLLGFLPSIIPAIGGMLSSAFGFAIPAITGLFGTAIKLAIPAALGALGLKWIANKWLNREGAPEVIAPDDPRLDPASELYDPNLQVSEPGVMDKLAGKVKDMGLIGSAVAGYAAFKGGTFLAKKGLGLAAGGAAAAGRWGAQKLLGRGVAAAGAGALGAGSSALATARLNAALAARAASRGLATGGVGGAVRGAAGMLGRIGANGAARTGLGTAAKLLGKTALRGFLGPIGLAWLAYDVVKFGYEMYKKHSDDGKKLNRFRMAGYGYHHKDEEHVSKLLAMEGELVKHVGIKEGVAYLKDSIAVEQVMEYFNVNKDDTAASDQWNKYFFGRFMPVFLSFATAMHALTGKYDVFDMDTVLDPSQQLKACDQVVFSREQGNPYDIMTSGFSGEDDLDMDKTKVMEVYKLVRQTLEVNDRKTKGKYIAAADAKDEKTRATRTKQIQKMNQEAEQKQADKWNPLKRLDDGIDSVFGTGRLGRVLSTVTKAALSPIRAPMALGGWLGEKIGNAFSGGSSPNFAGKPGKGWTPEVAAAVKWGADQLGIDPNHLASVISFETGGTFDPSLKNKRSSATGLIQLMNYGDGLPGKLYYGHTREQFAALSVSEQMKYVVKYFQSKGIKPGASLGSIYDAVTGTGYKRGSRSYELNKVWDANKDGIISPGESVTSGAFKDHMKDYFGSAANEVSASNNGVLGVTNVGKNNTAPSGGGVPSSKAQSAKVDMSMESAIKKGTTLAGTKASMAPGAGVLKGTAGSRTSPQPNLDMFPNSVSPTANGVASPGAVLGTDTRPYKAAAYARRKGLKSTTGYCARYVRVALQDGGGYKFQGVGSAYQYHTQGVLTSAGFMQIAAGTKWQVGDVMVYRNNSKHPHGHIQIWDGRNWISDFIQNGWLVYGGTNPFSLWRDKNHLNGAQPGTGWTTADGKNVGGSDGNSASATFNSEGGVGVGVTRRKWTQDKPILGGDALWGGNKNVPNTGTKSSKADVKANAKDAKPDSAVVSEQKRQADGLGLGNKAKTDTSPGAYKPTATTSAKSAETAVSRESKQATEAKQEIARKEKDATAQQTLARTQRETDVTILQQQLQVQTDTLNEIRGLRRDLSGFAESSIQGTKSIKDFIQTTKASVQSPTAPDVKNNPMSPIQPPKTLLEPVSMMKS